MLVFLFFIQATNLWARLGGGGGYSGGGGGGGGGFSGGGGGYSGGSGYSGGGGGGDISNLSTGEIVCTVIFISLALLPRIILGNGEEDGTVTVRGASRKPVDWSPITSYDPNFSHVLFRDFAYTLFTRVHEARGDGNLDRFGQFMDSDARVALLNLRPGVRDVFGVIVGSMRVSRISVEKSSTMVGLIFEANYSESYDDGPPSAVYTRQAWVLERQNSVQSRPPETITSFDCLNCGSPFQPTPEGACSHCGEQVKPGQLHWSLITAYEMSRKTVMPALTSSVPDVGLDLPTRFAPDYYSEKERILAVNPQFEFTTMIGRFKYIFFELQRAWSEQDLDRLRPYETDSLFQNHSYWVREYQKQGLRNELDRVSIQRLELVKIRSDKYYDAITCRIFASMTDCTRRVNDGSLVCGSPSKIKRFSEYWTFIRGRGAKDHQRGDRVCPNCGATLKITMAGECDYCDSKLTSGQFDWVLSEIQQDEEYGG